jgi:hypothetical protein
VAALVIGDEFPRRRAARARWTSPIPALRWPNRAGLGSGTSYATCVTHLGPWRGSARLGDTVATAEAGLHDGARRRARVRAILGIGKGANGAERVHGAKAGQNRAMWRWCTAAEGPPRWSGGGGVPACVVWLQGWATAYRT